MSSSTESLVEELTRFCQSDSLSEGGLQEIVDNHGWQTGVDDPTISYDFFLLACRNEKVTEGILRYLLRTFPDAGRFIDLEGQSPLTHACHNNHVTLGIVQLLLDAFPDSVRNIDTYDGTPLSSLCCFAKNLDNEVAVDILKLLLERCPESVRHACYDGCLPIHHASGTGMKSPEFCRLLIEAYPGSEQVPIQAARGGLPHLYILPNDDEHEMHPLSGALPIHCACRCNTAATAQYLLQLYPESIKMGVNDATDGFYPIHWAIIGVRKRADTEAAIDMVQYLLEYNPNVAKQELHGKPPIYWVCRYARGVAARTEKMTAHLKTLQVLYDAHPEAMENVSVTSNLHTFPQEVQAFIDAQLHYAFLAREQHMLQMPDENGRFPLHIALRDNVTFGSIKLLVKGNPSVVSVQDNRGMMPLHIACKYHESASVVQYLLDLDPTSLQSRDLDGNSALHHACCGGKHETIKLLMEKYDFTVSIPNSNKHLPIDLLLQSEAVIDRDSMAYTEDIFRLLSSYPQAAMNYMPKMAPSE